MVAAGMFGAVVVCVVAFTLVSAKCRSMMPTGVMAFVVTGVCIA